MNYGFLIIPILIQLFIGCEDMKNDHQVGLDEIISSEIEFANLSRTVGRKTAFLNNLLDSATVFVPMPAKSIDV